MGILCQLCPKLIFGIQISFFVKILGTLKLFILNHFKQDLYKIWFPFWHFQNVFIFNVSFLIGIQCIGKSSINERSRQNVRLFEQSKHKETQVNLIFTDFVIIKGSIIISVWLNIDQSRIFWIEKHLTHSGKYLNQMDLRTVLRKSTAF